MQKKDNQPSVASQESKLLQESSTKAKHAAKCFANGSSSSL